MALEDSGPEHIGSAAERERWRGRIDATLEGLQNFAKDINSSVIRTDEKLTGKIDASEKALNVKIDNFKDTFDKSLDALDDKFADLKNTVTKLVVICSTIVFLGSVVVPMAIKALLGMK